MLFAPCSSIASQAPRHRACEHHFHPRHYLRPGDHGTSGRLNVDLARVAGSRPRNSTFSVTPNFVSWQVTPSGFVASLGDGQVVRCGCSATLAIPPIPTQVEFTGPRSKYAGGFEDDQLRLELSLPGFGGLAFDEDGGLVVYIPSGRTSAESRAILQTQLARAEKDVLVRALSDDSRIQWRVSQYPFSSLVAWKDALASQKVRDAVVGIDADELRNRVTIMIRDATAQPAAKARAQAAGIPVEALNFAVIDQPVATASLRSEFSTMGGGIQIISNSSLNPDQPCTLGFNVGIVDPLYPTSLAYLVTAAHCVGVFGDREMCQPSDCGIGSLAEIGFTSIDPEWNLTDPACGSYSVRAHADVALVSYTATTARAPKVAFTASLGTNYSGGSISVTGWWTNIASPGTVYQGQVVDKVGRTTGWTRGSVSATCVAGDIDSTEDGVADYRILCAQSVTGSRVGKGESGSPVFIPPPPGQITQPLTPLGILFAGNNMWSTDSSDGWGEKFCSNYCTYWFSDWNSISTHLGVSLDP